MRLIFIIWIPILIREYLYIGTSHWSSVWWNVWHYSDATWALWHLTSLFVQQLIKLARTKIWKLTSLFAEKLIKLAWTKISKLRFTDPFVMRIHRSPVDSHHKGSVMRNAMMFSWHAPYQGKPTIKNTGQHSAHKWCWCALCSRWEGPV